MWRREILHLRRAALFTIRKPIHNFIVEAKKQRQLEQISTSVLIKSLKNHSMFAYKIPDTLGQRFTPAKPFDIASCWKGHFLGIEVKYLDEPMAFGMRHLRDSQIAALSDLDRAGGLSYVLVIVKHSKRDIRLHWFEFDFLRQECERRGGSIPKDDLVRTLSTPKIHGRFDLTDFIEDLELSTTVFG